MWNHLISMESSLAEASIDQSLEQFLIVLSLSLSVVTLSRVFVWTRQIPYTLLLVIVGLCLSLLNIRLITLSPELILEIFLPPLLFEATWNMRWRDLKENWLPVALFAVVGVVISIGGIALSLSQFTTLSLSTALLVGASVSATDPVSVLALFRDLGASKRLTTLMEGESIFNDGVAVVSFVVLVGTLAGTESFSLSETVFRFFSFIGIGVAIGCLIGFAISYLTQRFDFALVEQSITLVSAYGTYIVTEDLGGSGVIGVVTVGLILGNYGSRVAMNPRTRLLVSDFWEFLAFFVNSIVFLLIGDQIQFSGLGSNFEQMGVAIAAVVITRVVMIFGLGGLSNLFIRNKIGWKELIVLSWGGLRGSVSIALALSVPIVVTGRQEIIDAVFAVVLFTLLVQGLTTKMLLEKLDLIGDRPLRQQYSELLARRVALKRVLDYLTKLDTSPDIDSEFYRYEQELVTGQLKSVEEEIEKLQKEYPQLRSQDMEQLRQQLLEIEADTYAEYIRAGRLNTNLSPLLQQILAEAEGEKIELNSPEQA